MNSFKKLLPLMLILLMVLLIVPQAFAADVDGTNDSVTVYNQGNSEVNLVDSSNIENSSNTVQVLDSSNDENMLGDKIDNVYVSTDGSDTNDGSQSSPVKTIEHALTLVNDGGSINIASGEYFENNINITIPVTIKGDNTIINGNGTGRIFNITTPNGTNVFISGITFKNGFIRLTGDNGTPLSINESKTNVGGAVYIKDAVVSIDNCSFINNTAYEGGAIYWNGDNGTVSNSYFDKNTAKNGAGISWGGLFTSRYGGANGKVINCTFNNGTATNYGAAPGITAYSDNLTIIGSNFTNNKGLNTSDHGVVFAYGSNTIVNDCLFENNTMESQGVAIRVEGDDSQIVNSKFINNTLTNLSQLGTIKEGGALEICGDNVLIKNNTFIANGGEYCQDGGAITVLVDDGYVTNIENNTFINNTGGSYGGAVYVENLWGSNTVNFINNTFDGNNASIGTAISSSLYTEHVFNLENNTFKNMNMNDSECIVIYQCSGTLNTTNSTIINCSGNNTSLIYLEYGTYTNPYVTANSNDTTTIVLGNSTPITITVSDDNGNLLSGGSVDIIANGTTIGSSLSLLNGTVSTTFTPSALGTYLINATYDSGENVNLKTAIINVISANSTIENETDNESETTNESENNNTTETSDEETNDDDSNTTETTEDETTSDDTTDNTINKANSIENKTAKTTEKADIKTESATGYPFVALILALIAVVGSGFRKK